MKCNFNYLLLLFIGLQLYSCQGSEPKQLLEPGSKPSFLLIIADDIEPEALGCYGNTEVSTPTLDSWAENGWRFNNFYVTSPICSPSRASILTGRLPQEVGVVDILRPSRADQGEGLSNAYPTFAQLLQSAGYETALIGKWHLGYQYEHHPLNKGFDQFKGFLSGHIDYISHVDASGQYGLMNGVDNWNIPSGEHLTKILTDEAISFLASSHAQYPYCLVLSYATPHRPYLLPGEQAIFPQQKAKRDRSEQRYIQMIELLDQQLGRIQEVVDSNTLIFFLGDNGNAILNQINGIPQKGKGTLYEGGLKVPAIAYRKGQIGTDTIDAPYSSMDLYPTLLSLAEVEDAYSGTGELIWDASGTLHTPQRAILRWNFQQAKAIRQGNWKAIFIPADHDTLIERYFFGGEFTPHQELLAAYDGHFPLLFNLAEDPQEQHDLALAHPDRLSALWALLRTQSK